jgi:hypothetical protein
MMTVRCVRQEIVEGRTKKNVVRKVIISGFFRTLLIENDKIRVTVFIQKYWRKATETNFRNKIQKQIF